VMLVLMFQFQFALKHISCSTVTRHSINQRQLHQLVRGYRLHRAARRLLYLGSVLSHPMLSSWTDEFSHTMAAVATSRRYRSSIVSYSLLLYIDCQCICPGLLRLILNHTSMISHFTWIVIMSLTQNLSTFVSNFVCYGLKLSCL